MSCHLDEREEKQMSGTPEGVPVLAPLSLAGLAHPAPESSPSPPEPEAERPTAQPDEPASAEPFAEPVGLPRLRPMKKGQRLVKKPAAPKLQISPEQRLLILDTWRRSGLPAADFSTIVGIPKHTLYGWKKRFEQEGPAGLMDRPRGSRKGSRVSELTKRTILMLKESNPDWGCQRISDMLVRGPALPASPTAVARVLKEAGYELEEVPTRRHPDKVRRFERAKPNQLWQTDLFTFLLKRQNRRVYLVAFMDDHSRFITGFGLHASQSTALVLEVLRTALSAYGVPKEILTDNRSADRRALGGLPVGETAAGSDLGDDHRSADGSRGVRPVGNRRVAVPRPAQPDAASDAEHSGATPAGTPSQANLSRAGRDRRAEGRTRSCPQGAGGCRRAGEFGPHPSWPARRPATRAAARS